MKCREVYELYGSGIWIGVASEETETPQYILSEELIDCSLCEREISHIINFQTPECIESHLINPPSYIIRTPLCIKTYKMIYVHILMSAWKASMMVEKQEAHYSNASSN